MDGSQPSRVRLGDESLEICEQAFVIDRFNIVFYFNSTMAKNSGRIHTMLSM